MIKVKKAESFGLFDVDALNNKESKDGAFQWASQNGFIVLSFSETSFVKRHPVMQDLVGRTYKNYVGFAITTKGEGVSRFNDMFHRSNSFVSEHMLPCADFLSIFSQECRWMSQLISVLGDVQIRPIKKMYLRQKHMLPYGVFNAEMLRSTTRDQVFQFVQENQFMVLVNDPKGEYPGIKSIESNIGCEIIACAVALKGFGMENFKDTFYRSSEFAYEKMISGKDLKKIFEKDTDIVFFLEKMESLGEIQVKLMKRIEVREKKLQNI